MKNIIALVFQISVASYALAQSTITGTVYETKNGNSIPIPFASIYWLNTQKGVSSNTDGLFTLEKPDKTFNWLVISGIGYKRDTVRIDENQKYVQIELIPEIEKIEEVSIREKRDASFISRREALLTTTITSSGLQKLACCNLSESFENDPSVDIGYSDAISGAKQIQMLGLAGKYTQLLTENIPGMSGIAANYGLLFIPGTWMESIQISKGMASVLNGYESVTGQINVEMKKPQNSESFSLNIYSSSERRLETNLNTAKPLNDQWSTMVLSHASVLNQKHDNNHDGFSDMPVHKTIGVFNRWNYDGRQLKSQFGITYLNDMRTGGEMEFKSFETSQNLYGFLVKNQRIGFFGKTALLLNNKAGANIALQFWTSLHTQDAQFGNQLHNANQNSVYSNLLYQTRILNPNHQLISGISFKGEKLREKFSDSIDNQLEMVTGVFSQYTFSGFKGFTLVAGIRTDFNNRFGWLVTPRLHLKFDIDSITTVRISAGVGYRSPQLVPENLSLLASSRQISVIGHIDIEKAQNFGGSFTKYYSFDQNNKITLNLDYYHTRFLQQMVTDLDYSPQRAVFYQLKGKSYSNSAQAHVMWLFKKSFEFGLAWRINEVKTNYINGTNSKPLVSKHKGLISASYFTKWEKWKIDCTLQYNGKSRLPDTAENPVEYQFQKTSPSYFILHGQITRKLKWFDIYLGSENLLNYTQKQVIISPDDPFGPYFDSSIVWGPVSGRMAYAGIRLNIK